MFRLTWVFVRIGAVAFGGLGATLALLEEELVRRRSLLSKDDLAEAFTYTKLLPGSTVVQIVAYLSARLGGWRTSAACSAAFLLPSALVMLGLAYGDAQLADLPAFVPVKRGMLAAVVGLLVLTIYRLAAPIRSDPLALALALAAFTVSYLVQLNAAWIVIAAGAVGIAARRG